MSATSPRFKLRNSSTSRVMGAHPQQLLPWGFVQQTPAGWWKRQCRASAVIHPASFIKLAATSKTLSASWSPHVTKPTPLPSLPAPGIHRLGTGTLQRRPVKRARNVQVVFPSGEVSVCSVISGDSLSVKRLVGNSTGVPI